MRWRPGPKLQAATAAVALVAALCASNIFDRPAETKAVSPALEAGSPRVPAIEPSKSPNALFSAPAPTGHESEQARTAPPSRQLLRELADAIDLRSFAMRALERPAEGGYFYAMVAIDYCARDTAFLKRFADESVSREVARAGTVASARLRAID